MDKQKVIDTFPLEKPREGQIETTHWMINKFESGKKFCILEGPCGCGKSAIALNAALLHSRSYWITATKVLQDQLQRDFGDNGIHGYYITDLKGRNAYNCGFKMKPELYGEKKTKEWNNRPHNCAEGHCRRKGKSRYIYCLKNDLCEYFNRVKEAITAKICCMNYSSFLYQTKFTNRFDTRDLIIIDEGHNIESQLMSFISLTISDADLDDIKLPEYEDPMDYAVWMEDINIAEALKEQLIKARISEDIYLVDKFERLIRKVEYFLSEMRNNEYWVVEYESKRFNNKAVFKPVFPGKHAWKHLFDYANRIIIMSATILDVNVMAKALNIDKSMIAAKRLASKFPVENRPIYFQPACKVTGGKKNMIKWGRPLTKAVEQKVELHEGHRGIIHTHNFYIAEMLINDCKPKISRRFLFQKDFDNKMEMLKHHEESDDTIIIAPAMHEGIDLVGDYSRFQIICKIPFPNHFDDKQLAARIEKDGGFYDWLVALKFCQSIGRSVRNKDDWAKTYILDESFGWWLRKNKRLIPKWLINAIVE